MHPITIKYSKTGFCFFKTLVCNACVRIISEMVPKTDFHGYHRWSVFYMLLHLCLWHDELYKWVNKHIRICYGVNSPQHSFIHTYSFNSYLLSPYSIPGTVLGKKHTTVNETGPCCCGVYILVKG